LPPAGRPRPRAGRPTAARYAAPLLFLVAVTIAVLLIRSGLEGGAGSSTTGTGVVTHPSTAPTTPSGTTRRGATTTAAAQFYTVVAGDTYGSISAKTGVPVSELEALNPGVSTNALQVGQKLRVK
jgi:LysM repeat protein